MAIGLFFLTLAQAGPDAGMWPLLAAPLSSVTFFGVLATTGGRAAWRYGIGR